MKIKVLKEVDVKYLDLDVAVRYEDEDMPHDAPLRDGDSWKALINLDTGYIMNWKKGECLKFYMKVCDQGTYILLDADKEEITRIEDDYVPNSLLPGEYGDYLELDIDETGKILNWLSDADLTDFHHKGD